MRSPLEALHFELPSYPHFPPQVLCGLLHLGNLHFAEFDDEAQPCQLKPNANCECLSSAYSRDLGDLTQRKAITGMRRQGGQLMPLIAPATEPFPDQLFLAPREGRWADHVLQGKELRF